MAEDQSPPPQEGQPQSYGYAQRLEYVSDYWRARYERETGRNWDRFYACKSPKGFLASTKERQYLVDELAGELATARLLLEVGCGAGHSIVPLARACPSLRFCAVDISKRAIELLRANDAVPHDRCTAAVCDVERDELPAAVVAEGSVDCVLLVFVLSSCTPAAHSSIARKLRRVLAPGGVLFFRDYARGDECQVDFDAIQPPRKISANFYVRSDGTRAYFFDSRACLLSLSLLALLPFLPHSSSLCPDRGSRTIVLRCRFDLRRKHRRSHRQVRWTRSSLHPSKVPRSSILIRMNG